MCTGIFGIDFAMGYLCIWKSNGLFFFFFCLSLGSLCFINGANNKINLVLLNDLKYQNGFSQATGLYNFWRS